MLRHAARRALHSTAPARLAAAAADMPAVAAAPVAGAAAVASGLKVGAVDAHGPTSSVVLVLPAGAAAESLSAAQQGAAHHLANYALKYTATATPLKHSREIEMRGMQVRAVATREHIAYEVQCMREDVPFALETLADVVYNTKYNAWEFKGVKAATNEQAAAAMLVPATAGLELAHRLAFRSGLGNSVFAAPHSGVTNASVAEFAKANLAVGANAALFATGFNPEELAKLAEAHFDAASGSAAARAATKYFGGESRVELPNGHNVTLAFPGAARGSADAATLAVLATLLGDGTKYVKWGAESGSPLVQAGRSASAAVRAAHLAYADAGLFAVSSSCKTSAANATKGAQLAVAALKKAADGAFAQSEGARAVAQAKAAVLLDSRVAAARAGALDLLRTGAAVSAADRAAALDKVTLADVAKAAKTLLAAKPTLAVAGKTALLPYVDQLGL